MVGLEVDFGPFTCIAGENAAGKSNLFDAIEFLSLLANNSLMEAAQQVRSTVEHRIGDPRDLFWRRAYETSSIKLAAEMIVPATADDDFGQPAKASITFLRYEVEIGFEPAGGSRKMGRLVLLSETLRHINLGDAPRRLRFPHSAKNWRSLVIVGRRSGTAFISTTTENGETLVNIHQDGGSRGKPIVAAANRAPATVISTITQAENPTMLAAKREMQSWHRLALEPAAMRAPDGYNDPQVMAPNGRHLASTLYRVATSQQEPRNVYARVASRLSSLTGLRVENLRVDADDARETLTLVLGERGGMEIPARSLSEGTLRFLALCVLFEDDSMTGLFCTEEPENGIHPANMPAMVALIQDLAMDASEPPDQGNPFRQVIVNTHSPAVVQLVSPEDLLFADAREIDGEDGVAALRLRPMQNSWRSGSTSNDLPVGKADLITYLTAPSGAQITFDLHHGAA
jgi:predicted ATPase